MKSLYVVYDIIARMIVGLPFLYPHDGPAVRTFVDALNNPQSGLKEHQEDFQLVCLGTIDEETFAIEAKPRVVLTGAAYKAQQNAGASE